tara:strand:+ start:752 stop:982 length:231 start_codon:yes stop_codon:yes gene_type:complete
MANTWDTLLLLTYGIDEEVLDEFLYRVEMMGYDVDALSYEELEKLWLEEDMADGTSYGWYLRNGRMVPVIAPTLRG